MSQYILKSDVIAEIEKLKSVYLSIFSRGETEESCYEAISCISICNKILSLIDNIEVKKEIEIPINKEKIKEIDNRIERQYKNMIRKLKEANHKTEDFSMNN